MSDFRSRSQRPWLQSQVSLFKLFLSYPLEMHSSKPIAPHARKTRLQLVNLRHFDRLHAC
jgi:hypothetical protein